MDPNYVNLTDTKGFDCLSGISIFPHYPNKRSKLTEEENEIKVNVSLCLPGVLEDVVLKKVGTDDWTIEVKITNENASNYLDIDVTSEVQQILRNAVNNNYGMQLMSGGYLSFISASNSEIDSANTSYRVITPMNVNYAVQKKGANYFAPKENVEALETNMATLQSDVSTIIAKDNEFLNKLKKACEKLKLQSFKKEVTDDGKNS